MECTTSAPAYILHSASALSVLRGIMTIYMHSGFKVKTASLENRMHMEVEMQRQYMALASGVHCAIATASLPQQNSEF